MFFDHGRFIKANNKAGQNIESGFIPVADGSGSWTYQQYVERFQNPFDRFFQSIANRNKQRAVLLQELEDEFIEYLRAQEQIDGGDLVTFDPFLQAVWRCNDIGPPLDDSLNGFSLTQNGSITYLQTAPDAINGNAFQVVNKDGYFSRVPGFQAGTNEDWSLNIWFKLDNGFAASNWGLFDLELGGGNECGINIQTNTTWQILYRVGGVSKINVFNGAIGQNINDDNWHMLTITHQYSPGQLVIWLDRTIYNTYNFTGPADFSLRNFNLARGVNNNFRGFIDETRYWKGSGAILSPNAINTLWNNGQGFFP